MILFAYILIIMQGSGNVLSGSGVSVSKVQVFRQLYLRNQLNQKHGAQPVRIRTTPGTARGLSKTYRKGLNDGDNRKKITVASALFREVQQAQDLLKNNEKSFHLELCRAIFEKRIFRKRTRNNFTDFSQKANISNKQYFDV